jgi:hypothetical protein
MHLLAQADEKTLTHTLNTALALYLDLRDALDLGMWRRFEGHSMMAQVSPGNNLAFLVAGMMGEKKNGVPRTIPVTEHAQRPTS